jgi:hypothetical protein
MFLLTKAEIVNVIEDANEKQTNAIEDVEMKLVLTTETVTAEEDVLVASCN